MKCIRLEFYTCRVAEKVERKRNMRWYPVVDLLVGSVYVQYRDGRYGLKE